jgi:protein TIF31
VEPDLLRRKVELPTAELYNVSLMAEINRITPMKDGGTDDEPSSDDQMVIEESTVNESKSFVNIKVHTNDGSLLAYITRISTAESVQSIKQVLLEYQTTGFYTSYYLETRENDDDEETFKRLNEYNELAAYITPSIIDDKGDMNLYLVTDNYDVKKIRHHMKVVRDFLTCPPLINGNVTDTDTKPVVEAETKAVISNSKDCGDKKKQSKNNKKKNNNETAETAASSTATPSIQSIIDEKVSLNDFYQKNIGVFGSPNFSCVQGGGQTAKVPSQCIRSISLSGWNPPPPYRKLQGDLVYIEVVSDDALFQVTGTASGFYVNKSTKGAFDPTPADSAHFSHELLFTLLSYSPSLRSSWESFLQCSAIEESNRNISVFDFIATLYAQGKGDSLNPKRLQWNVFLPPKSINDQTLIKSSNVLSHSYDMARVESDLSNGFSVDEKGPLREWHNEIQQIRDITPKDLSEKVMTTRLMYKTITEFTDACKVIVVALVDGHIQPMNPMDAESAYVYIYNNIFISKAIDAKETFKLCNGDESTRKMSAHDIRNQMIVNSVPSVGLRTALQCCVDYLGDRFICQSIIPDILLPTEKQCPRLGYGCLEPGKRVSVKTSSLEKMKELCKQFYIPQRAIPAVIPVVRSPTESKTDEVSPYLPDALAEGDAQANRIRIDDKDEVDPIDSPSVTHVGPVECKILECSDGRNYLLEVFRLTPRDANYVKGEKGTNCVEKAYLDQVDDDLAMTYIIRQELVTNYISHKILSVREKIIMEAAKLSKTASKDDANETNETKNEECEDVDPLKKVLKFTPEVVEKIQAITPESLNLELNPNVFFGFDCSTDPAVMSKDEETARDLAQYLHNVLLPLFTEQIRQGEIVPFDNQHMVSVMHSHGINMRYLGQLATLAKNHEAEDVAVGDSGKQRIHKMPTYWLAMLEIEIIARSLKHVVNSYLRTNKLYRNSPASLIVEIFNMIFASQVLSDDQTKANNSKVEATASNGDKKKDKKKKVKGKKGAAAAAANSYDSINVTTSNTLPQEYVGSKVSRTEVLESLIATVRTHFCYDLQFLDISNSSGVINSSRIPLDILLRRVCQQVGVRVVNKTYDFKSVSPFTSLDIYELLPKVKSCEPTVPLPEARGLIAHAADYLQSQGYEQAFQLTSEAQQIINQVTGPYHQENILIQDQLTQILLRVEDFPAAITSLGRQIQLVVQTNGLDCHEMVLCHSQLFEIYNVIGNHSLAIKHLLAQKYLVELMGGPSHPELVNIYVRLFYVYVNDESYNDAHVAIEKAASYCTDLFKSCTIMQIEAEFFSKLNYLQEALDKQKLSVNLLQQLCGESDAKTVEAKKVMTQYQRNIVEYNVQVGRAQQNAREQLLQKISS